MRSRFRRRPGRVRNLAPVKNLRRGLLVARMAILAGIVVRAKGRSPVSPDLGRLARARRPGPAVSTVLLVGTGQVGVRAARQLVDTPGLSRVLITSREPDACRRPRGGDGRAGRGRTRARRVADAELPEGITAVAVATAAPDAYRWVRAAVEAGVAVAVVVDDGFGELEAAATDRGRVGRDRMRAGSGADRGAGPPRGRRLRRGRRGARRPGGCGRAGAASRRVEGRTARDPG